MGIDEVSYRRGHRYLTNVVDLDTSREPPTVVKIDAEGYEGEIIAGMRRTDHRAILATLAVHASPRDLLIVPPEPRPRHDAALWLAPEFPGRMWVGHWFLTSHHAERVARANPFFADTPEAQRRFLGAEGIRFVFVPRGHSTRDLRSTPGVHLLVANGAGKLYRYDYAEPNRR